MKANIDLALHRVVWMGPGGLALHAAKKALVNFNDGTFAWKMDGGERFSVGGGPVFPRSSSFSGARRCRPYGSAFWAGA